MLPNIPTPDFIEATKAILSGCEDIEIVKTHLSAWMKIAQTLLEDDRSHLRRLVIEHGQLKNDDVNETARNTIRWIDRLSESFANEKKNGH